MPAANAHWGAPLAGGLAKPTGRAASRHRLGRTWPDARRWRGSSGSSAARQPTCFGLLVHRRDRFLLDRRALAVRACSSCKARGASSVACRDASNPRTRQHQAGRASARGATRVPLAHPPLIRREKPRKVASAETIDPWGYSCSRWKTGGWGSIVTPVRSQKFCDASACDADKQKRKEAVCGEPPLLAYRTGLLPWLPHLA
jgi:hypothetical protein